MSIRIGIFLGYGIFGILAFLVVLNFESAFSQQNNTINIETPDKVLPIYKESKGTVLITRDGAFEGPFNTTYSVVANRTDFTAIGDSIKRAIVRDFDKTPTIGYIKTYTIGRLFQSYHRSEFNCEPIRNNRSDQ